MDTEDRDCQNNACFSSGLLRLSAQITQVSDRDEQDLRAAPRRGTPCRPRRDVTQADRQQTAHPGRQSVEQALERLLVRRLGGAVHRARAQRTDTLGACPRKKSLKDNVLKLRIDDFKISYFPETRVLTKGQNFCTFLKNL